MFSTCATFVTSLLDSLEADCNGVSMVVGFSLSPFICGAFMFAGHVACCCSSPFVAQAVSAVHHGRCSAWVFFCVTDGKWWWKFDHDEWWYFDQAGQWPYTLTKHFTTNVAGHLCGLEWPHSPHLGLTSSDLDAGPLQ